MRRSGIIAAYEHIDHQADDFGKKLESFVGFLLTELEENRFFENAPLLGKNADGHPIIKTIESLIFIRLGIKVDFRTNTENVAAILPFYSNRNHIFLDSYIRGHVALRDQMKLLNTFHEKQGTVNLHTAKVTGIFSEYIHPLFINFTVLYQQMKMTPSEITAVILHELGHAFSACYYSDRTDTTNQVLASIGDRILNRRGKEDIDYIYLELSKITENVKKEDVDRLLNGPKVVAGATWFKVFISCVKSQLRHDKYSETAFEELSDSFASRFGYGELLTLGLQKLQAGNPENSTASRIICYLTEIIVTAYVGLIVAAMITGMGVPGVFIGAVFSLFYTYIWGENSKDYTYDKVKDRYLRIRKDAIEQLKDKNLPKQSVKELLNSIYTVDEVIKGLKSYSPMLTKIANFIFASHRDAVAAIEAEKLLENLASNDLFVISAEIKTQA